RAELLQLERAYVTESAVVEYDDCNVQPVTSGRRQLLQVPAKSAVTRNADDGTIGAADGHTECGWESVAECSLVAWRDERVRLVHWIVTAREITHLCQLVHEHAVLGNGTSQRRYPLVLRLDLLCLLLHPLLHF